MPNNHDLSSLIREVTFGVEDGMVSTLGAITGMAVGSGDRYTVLLSGMVIIAVESISMGIGSYISNSASKEVQAKSIADEKKEQQKFPEQERRELYHLFLRDGWNKRLATKMAKSASLNRRLMLKEHEYRELGIFPYDQIQPTKNALFMFGSYIIGGLCPLISYFLFPLQIALFTSVIFTLLGLFLLGSLTTHFTSISPLKAGTRLALMGSIAFIVGLVVGELAALIK